MTLTISDHFADPILDDLPSREVDIDNRGNSSELTDYQVDIDVSNHVDKQGVRFVDDNLQIVDYWEEDSDTIWAEIPKIIGNKVSAIRILHGDVDSASDGEATFEFFDDFETGDLTTGPMSWTPRASTESNGVAHIDCSGGSYQQMYVSSSLYENTAWAFDWKKIESGDTTFIFGFISNVYNWGVFNGVYDFEIIGSNIYIENDRINRIISTTWANDLLDHTFEVTKDGTGNFELFIDGISEGTAHDTEFSSSSYMSFWEHNYIGIDIDNFRVRKYTSPEPTAVIA